MRLLAYGVAAIGRWWLLAAILTVVELHLLLLAFVVLLKIMWHGYYLPDAHEQLPVYFWFTVKFSAAVFRLWMLPIIFLESALYQSRLRSSVRIFARIGLGIVVAWAYMTYPTVGIVLREPGYTTDFDNGLAYSLPAVLALWTKRWLKLPTALLATSPEKA